MNSERDSLRPGRIQKELSARFVRRRGRFPRASRKPLRALPENPSSHFQRCIAKLSYTKNWRTKSWRAHGYYLQREGAQREGERGLGFNHERADIRLSDLANEWQKARDPYIFKLVISPENGQRLDLRQHARDLMREVEKDAGVRLEWAAIDHHNTANPHVHILIRGSRPDGKALRFERAYVQRGFRIRSQELATRELGYRRDREISQALRREVEAQRFTSLDRSILRKIDRVNTITFEGTLPRTRRAREWRQNELGRLQVLSEMGLARKRGSLRWEVSRSIPRVLRQLEELGDITRSVARHRPFLREPRAQLRVLGRGEEREIHGRVVGTGLLNELRGDTYLLIEGRDGFVHLIRQNTALERAFGEGRVHLGYEAVVRQHLFERERRTYRHLGIHEPELGTLEQFQEFHRKPVRVVEPELGRVYRGRLLGYASGPSYERYAVLESGRRLTALRTQDRTLEPGRRLEARVRVLRRGAERSATLEWRLRDLERDRGRERERSR